MSEFIILVERGTNNLYQVIEKDNSGSSHLLRPETVVDQLKKVESLKAEVSRRQADLAACQQERDRLCAALEAIRNTSVKVCLKGQCVHGGKCDDLMRLYSIAFDVLAPKE